MHAAALARAKREGRKTAWLTAYDATCAALAEQAGVDVLLVGDSLGMVCLGYETTVPVTLDDMIHHTKAVVRGRKHCWVVCDLPFGTYQTGPEQAFATSVRVLQETGCDAVKLEGGIGMAPTIRFLAERGIAVVAHIGLLPQSIKRLGTYRSFGPAEAERLMRDAVAVAEAGAVAVVLECVEQSLASTITSKISIPTVGIGSGAHCDGQVLVWHDLLGLSERRPSFAPAYADLRTAVTEAIGSWAADVRTGKFPGGEK